LLQLDGGGRCFCEDWLTEPRVCDKSGVRPIASLFAQAIPDRNGIITSAEEAGYGACIMDGF